MKDKMKIKNNLPILDKTETNELLNKARLGNKIARDKLVLHNIRLGYKLMNKFKPVYGEWDDNFQDVIEAICIAIDEYNSKSRKVSFSTYLFWAIKKVLCVESVRKYKDILTPHWIVELDNTVRKTTQKFIKEYGREPTEQELKNSIKLKGNQWEIYSKLKGYQFSRTSDMVVDGLVIEEIISSNSKPSEDFVLLSKIDKLKSIDDKGKEYLIDYLFEDKSSFNSISKKYKVSQETVSRKVKKAINEMIEKGYIDVRR